MQGYRLPSFDLKFVEKCSPAYCAAWGSAVYFALMVLSPLQYEWSVISLDGLAYAVAVFAGFFGGCYAVDWLLRDPNRTRAPVPIDLSPDLLINLTAVIGAVGIAFRVIDRFFLRNFQVAETLMETRESLSEGVSVFGYIGGIAYPMGLVTLLLIWLSGSQKRRPLMFGLACLMAFYPIAESLLQGSRATLVHVGVIVFLFARSTKAIPWLVRSPLALLGTGVALSALIEFVYELRSLQGNDIEDIADVFRQTAIGAFAQPPGWITDEIIASGGTGMVAGVLKVMTHLLQYVTHTWVVYFINFSEFDGELGWGRYHFFLPSRLIAILSGDQSFNWDPTLHGMLSGVGQTIVGGIYYDFGAAGPALALGFGAIATWIHHKAILYPERWLPLALYVAFGCAAVMVDNQLIASIGAFATWTFLGYAALHYLVYMLVNPPVDRQAGSASRPPMGRPI